MAYPYYPQQFYPQQVMPQQMAQSQQMRNTDFISVRNELEARNYPVAPGNSITFKDETAPYIYTKTMGFSQLDRPMFEKFKLVKEDATEPQIQAETFSVDKNTIDNIHGQIEALWAEISLLKEPVKEAPKKATKKKEVVEDE